MQDCYFYIDDSLPEEEKQISVICIECFDKNPCNAMFYRGSVDGYGPYEYKCCKCGKIIHENK